MRFAQLTGFDSLDARCPVDPVGPDRDLPALPRSGRNADFLQGDGEQPGGDLLAGRHDRIILSGVVDHGGFAAPADQPVRGSGHGRNHDCHLMAGPHLSLDVARNIADVARYRPPTCRRIS